MRIMFGEESELSISEFSYIYAMPVWYPQNGTSEDNPESYFVEVQFIGDSETESLGEYILDGTKETYKKAQSNFKSVLEKLLEKGYCKAGDFKNFQIY
jgi:hypothetical protein